jgi:hypothetical protein
MAMSAPIKLRNINTDEAKIYYNIDRRLDSLKDKYDTFPTLLKKGKPRVSKIYLNNCNVEKTSYMNGYVENLNLYEYYVIHIDLDIRVDGKHYKICENGEGNAIKDLFDTIDKKIMAIIKRLDSTKAET